MAKFFTNIKLFLVVTTLLTISCKKEEGFGGKATIKGIIKERTFNNEYTVLQSDTFANEEDVYIEFGDNNVVADGVKTSASGAFEFKYLLPGTYRIYIYTEDSARHLSSKIPLIKEIKISKGDDVVDAGIIYKYKTIDYDEGTSTIKGVIMMKYFINNFALIREISPAQNEDIFLIYNNHLFNDARERTLYNGSFAFTNLIKGQYKVYAYSDDPSGVSEKITEIRTVNITKDHQTVTLDTIYVNNK